MPAKCEVSKRAAVQQTATPKISKSSPHSLTNQHCDVCGTPLQKQFVEEGVLAAILYRTGDCVNRCSVLTTFERGNRRMLQRTFRSIPGRDQKGNGTGRFDESIE